MVLLGNVKHTNSFVWFVFVFVILLPEGFGRTSFDKMLRFYSQYMEFIYCLTFSVWWKQTISAGFTGTLAAQASFPLIFVEQH